MNNLQINNRRCWSILCWNIRGINAERKGDAVKSKILETNCDILCLQETKKEFWDSQYLRSFCSRHLDDFSFLPSVGNSGGSLIVWNSSKFEGHLDFQNEFAQSVNFNCKLSGQAWMLSNIYAEDRSVRGPVDGRSWL
jgi:exonuclease III